MPPEGFNLDPLQNLQLIGNTIFGLFAAWLAQYVYRKKAKKASRELDEPNDGLAIISGQIADMKPVKEGVKIVAAVRQDIQDLSMHLQEMTAQSTETNDLIEKVVPMNQAMMDMMVVQKDSLVSMAADMKFIRKVYEQEDLDRTIDRRANEKARVIAEELVRQKERDSRR